MKECKNQLHSPIKGHKLDKVWKIYFKSNGCSMLMFKGLTFFNAKKRRSSLQALYKDWCGKFIITK